MSAKSFVYHIRNAKSVPCLLGCPAPQVHSRHPNMSANASLDRPVLSGERSWWLAAHLDLYGRRSADVPLCNQCGHIIPKIFTLLGIPFSPFYILIVVAVAAALSHRRHTTIPCGGIAILHANNADVGKSAGPATFRFSYACWFARSIDCL